MPYWIQGQPGIHEILSQTKTKQKYIAWYVLKTIDPELKRDGMTDVIWATRSLLRISHQLSQEWEPEDWVSASGQDKLILSRKVPCPFDGDTCAGQWNGVLVIYVRDDSHWQPNWAIPLLLGVLSILALREGMEEGWQVPSPCDIQALIILRLTWTAPPSMTATSPIARLSVCDPTVLSASWARPAHALCSVAATKSTTYQRRKWEPVRGKKQL